MPVSAHVSPRRWWMPLLVLTVVLVSAPPCDAGNPTVRSIDGNASLLWAAGDNGLLLTSTDAGQTWKPFKSPAPAHWQRVITDGNDVLLFGGTGRPGHPEGFGKAAVFRRNAGETQFHSLPRRPEGWAYGGEFAGDFVAVFGQASAGSPGGLTRTATGGKLWTPIDTATRGYLLGGGFRSWRYGYAVGGGHRVVSLRALKEPQLHPAEVASSLALRGGAFVDGNEFWTVGDNAMLLRSQQDASPWSTIPARVPAAARSLADFETVASDGKGRAWVAGGQVGFVLHTPDGGRSWKLLPAPGPGGVRALHRLPDGTLLAGGDGGRIWRSGTGGDSWKCVHGRRDTDVLFVLSATDVGSWPAIVAHALAGCNVGVVFVTTPPDGRWVPPAQTLRAAALKAGASSVTVLNDFRSLVLAGRRDADAEAMIRTWSLKLDTDADAEMQKQIAAAIRQHRPTVVAMPPAGKGFSGAAGETRLIAQMTEGALDLAADPDNEPLKDTRLEAWTPKRIFQGDGGNDVWLAPWDKDAPEDAEDATTYVNLAAFPAGKSTNLEILTQAALWRLPWIGLLDRPARVSAWRARHERVSNGKRALFTSALTPHRLAFTAADKQRRSLASMAHLRMAAVMGRTGGAMTHLSTAALKAKGDPLAADRLLLAWYRLLSEGDLDRAHQARDLLLKYGRNHPLYEKAVLMTVATATSAEWRPHFRHFAPSGAADPPKIDKAMSMLASRGGWWDTAAGRVLLASALASEG
ncbi:MAG: WD40/YVTN/BNR-like repeat-containing protein [Phycisphaerae bacterium]